MSAMLKVGVSTEEGRTELLAFKAWVQENLGVIKFDLTPSNLQPLKVQIDKKDLGKTLTEALAAKHSIGINDRDLHDKVSAAVDGALGIKYKVGIDTNHIVTEVAKAISAGAALAQSVSISATVNTDGLKIGNGLALGEQFGRDFSLAAAAHILQLRDDINGVVSRPMAISFDTIEAMSNLRVGLHESIREATRGTGDGYDIKVDHDGLTKAVASAIRAGIAQAGSINVPVAAPVAPAGVIQPSLGGLPPATVAAAAPLTQQSGQQLTPPVVAELFRQSMIPLINKLDGLVGGAGASGEKKIAGGTRRASLSKAVKDPETGITLRQSESVDPDQASTMSETVARKNEEQWEREAIAKRERQRQQQEELAWARRNAGLTKALNKQDEEAIRDRSAAFAAAEAETEAQRRAAWKLATEARRDEANQAKDQTKMYEGDLDAQERLLKRQIQVYHERALAASKEHYNQRGAKISASALTVGKFGYEATSRALGARADMSQESGSLDTYRKPESDTQKAQRIRSDAELRDASRRTAEANKLDSADEKRALDLYNRAATDDANSVKQRNAAFQIEEKSQAESRRAFLEQHQAAVKAKKALQDGERADDAAKAAADKYITEQERAWVDAQERLLKRRIQIAYQKAQLAAREKYTGQGVNISAMADVVKEFDYGPVSRALGARVGLVREQSRLPDFVREQRKMSPEEVAHKQAMAIAYEKAKDTARGDYRGIGPNIQAASELTKQFPETQVREFLGKKQYLLDMTGSLANYKRELSETKTHADMVRDAHAKMARATWDAHSAARGFAGSLGAMWLTWGSTAPLVAAAAIGAGLRSVFTIGKDVEHQLTFVGALAGEAVPKIEAFGQAVRGGLIAPKEASEGMRALAQNGLSVTESLKALPDVLRLATVGEMNVADAALGATGVLSAFNLTIDNLGHVSDVFAKAAAMSNTSVGGMVEAMKQASTVSDQYGVSLEETAASLAVMAKRNISGTSAGTAFRNMMVELATPTDNAKKTIKALDLQFYDAGGSLKSYGDLLTEVKSKTDLLNQKGKLEALNNIFGERGGKAANAIISDFDAYSKALEEIRTKSDGFTRSVTNLLSEGTEGRLKGLFSEFQVASVQAFEIASASANGFIETLRKFVNTPEFTNSISALANNVAAFTTVIVENGSAIAGALVVYGAYRLIIGSVQAGILSLTAAQAGKAAADGVSSASSATNAVAMEAQAVAARGATVAMVGMRVSATALAATMTLGLSLVAAFALEWLIFSDHTDKATNALNTSIMTMERQGEQLDKELAKLRDNNRELALRNSLMQQGMTFEEASKKAKEVVNNDNTKDARQAFVDQYNAAQAKLAAAKLDTQQALSGPNPDGAAYSTVFTAETQAEKQLDKAAKALKNFDDNVQKQSLIARQTSIQSILSTRGSLMKEAAEFNKSFTEFANKTGYKGTDLKVAQGREETNEAFKARLNTAKTDFQAIKPGLNLPDSRAASRANSLSRAESKGVIEQLKDQDAAMKASNEFRRQLDEYRFRSSEMGQSITASLSEAASIREVAAAEEAHKNAVVALGKERAKFEKSGNSAEVQRIDNEIAHRTRLSEALKLEGDRRAQLAKWKAEASVRKDDRSFQESMNRSSSADVEAYIRSEEEFRNSQQQANGTMLPSRKAYNDAYSARASTYRQPIEDQFRKVGQANEDFRAVETIGRKLVEAGEATDGAYKETLEVARALVKEEERRLGLLMNQAMVASESAGEQARRQAVPQKNTNTLELFTDTKTWAEIAQAQMEKLSINAMSNAQIIDSSFSVAFQGMSNELTRFVTTGKFSFKGMLSFILGEIAKFLVSRVVTQLLQIGLSMMGGAGYSYNGGTGTTNAAGISGGRAGGGQVLGSSLYAVNEKQPELYHDGRTGKQYLMSGAGGGSVMNMKRVDEGYQPAGQGSSQGASIVVNLAVNVASDGTSEVKSDGGGDSGKAGDFAKILGQGVRQILVDELRPGGILYSA